MGNHHLVLGELVDFLTDKIRVDTHDERYRQKIARFLVYQKGFTKEQIESLRPLVVTAGNNRGQIKIDFCIYLAGKLGMIVKYGPGSLVTRYRPTLALTRLTEPYQIPIAVVTNGKDAHVLDGKKGHLISQGIESIPSAKDLLAIMKKAPLNKISSERAEMEARIVYCYEIDGSCPCDDTVCKL
jgi:hypothetical protein